MRLPGHGLLLATLVFPSAVAAQEKRQEGSDKSVGEVVVTAARAPDAVTAIDRKAYAVGKDVVAASGVLADLLRSVPSVSVDAEGNVALRGDTAVQITIDGKPAGILSGQARSQSVQSLPADRYERVEVITNPSAADSAEGSAGVINLVSKTARKAGRSGSVRTTVGTLGQYVLAGGLNYNSAKLSITGDLSLRHAEVTFGQDDTRRETSPTGAEASHVLRQDMQGFSDIVIASFGADYDLDARTRLGLQATYVNVSGVERGAERFTDIDAAGRTASSIRYIEPTDFWNESVQASLNFRRKIGDDQELAGDLQRERRPGRFDRPDRFVFLQPVAPDLFGVTNNQSAFETTLAKLNYKRPAPSGEIKAGYEFRADGSRTYSLQARGPSPAALVRQPGFSGDFEHHQRVHAGFVTWQRKWGDLTSLAGLRVEEARVTVDAPGFAPVDTRRLDPFPSVHLTYALDADRKLTASYSRRIFRPTAFMLSPAPWFQSERSVQRGNPGLKPPQTDAFEVGYERRGEAGTFSATGYWRLTHDDINSVVRPLDDGVLLNTVENLGLGRRGGASASFNRKLSKSLTATIAGDLYWREISPMPGQGERRSLVSGSGRLSLSWQATPADLLQLDANASSPTPLAQGDLSSRPLINLGYRRRLRPDLFAMITAQGVSGRSRQASYLQTSRLAYRRTTFGNAPTVAFGLTYNFGGARKPPPAFEFGGGGSGGGAGAPP